MNICLALVGNCETIQIYWEMEEHNELFQGIVSYWGFYYNPK